MVGPTSSGYGAADGWGGTRGCTGRNVVTNRMAIVPFGGRGRNRGRNSRNGGGWQTAILKGNPGRAYLRQWQPFLSKKSKPSCGTFMFRTSAPGWSGSAAARAEIGRGNV